MSGLRLADGVTFTHELSAIEAASGMLSGDDDLALWAVFAVGGLPWPAGARRGRRLPWTCRPAPATIFPSARA